MGRTSKSRREQRRTHAAAPSPPAAAGLALGFFTCGGRPVRRSPSGFISLIRSLAAWQCPAVLHCLGPNPNTQQRRGSTDDPERCIDMKPASIVHCTACLRTPSPPGWLAAAAPEINDPAVGRWGCVALRGGCECQAIASAAVATCGRCLSAKSLPVDRSDEKPGWASSVRSCRFPDEVGMHV